ncbi:hypothetical protein GCM10018790_80260 [Kitasatospora xanthocidica]|uniref:hypothetical protein n=1 Tax=Kitasatospora xanthocidica TaxID=83382 RepID=UPI00167B83F0|nr:hypothetical protein [Kitasatospora xanthocidica]GHF91029.1 hypothetical protein GCM10018790_80260 [Kitasatospora xanthocidica]
MLPSLPTLARHALDRGHTPAETYAILARRSGEPLPAARAVCLALDIPLAEATIRLNDCYDALLADPRPGTENDTGELLEALGVFDVPKALTATDLAVIDLFLAAIDAMGGIRAGHQHGLTRWFTTGNLTTAYLSLTAADPRPTTGDPATYWATLVTAGELLAAEPTPDPRIKPALIHCRSRAARP